MPPTRPQTSDLSQERDEWLTVEEVCTELKISRRTFDRWRALGKGVTWQLNSGVPLTEVAAWAGHSVEVLLRTYAKCMTGLEQVWISRMDDSLHLEDNRRDEHPKQERRPGMSIHEPARWGAYGARNL